MLPFDNVPPGVVHGGSRNRRRRSYVQRSSVSAVMSKAITVTAGTGEEHCLLLAVPFTATEKHTAHTYQGTGDDRGTGGTKGILE